MPLDINRYSECAESFAKGSYPEFFESIGKVLDVEIDCVETDGFENTICKLEEHCSQNKSIVCFDTDGILVGDPFFWVALVRNVFNKEKYRESLAGRLDLAKRVVERSGGLINLITNRVNPEVSMYNRVVSWAFGNMDVFEVMKEKGFIKGKNLFTGVNRQAPIPELEEIGRFIEDVKDGTVSVLRKFNESKGSWVRMSEILGMYLGNKHLKSFIDKLVVRQIRMFDSFVFVFDSNRLTTFMHDVSMSEVTFIYYLVCRVNGLSYRDKPWKGKSIKIIIDTMGREHFDKEWFGICGKMEEK